MQIRVGIIAAVLTAVSSVALGGPAAAADTGKIVYGSGGHVFIMNADGTSQVNLTPSWTAFAANPSLSPDGTKVVLETNPGQSTAEIYVIPATPTAQADATQLTSNSVVDEDPVWSPNGAQIAYVHDTPSTGVPRNYEVWKMNADGASKTRLTNDSVGEYDIQPTWSPDGTKIAWSTSSDDYGCDDNGTRIAFNQIHVMSSSGSGGTNIINNSAADTGNPDWSPDGTTIIYDRSTYTLGPDNGSGPTCVSNTTDSIYSSPSAGGSNSPIHTGYGPAYSPDGGRIVYNVSLGGNLAVMDANGNNSADLGIAGSFPDWGTAPVAKTATTTSLTVTGGNKLHDSGSVSPNVAGQSVTITLYRKHNGVFNKVSANTVTLNSSSAYTSSFSHPKAGTCKTTARYPGDSTHLASKKSVTHAC